MDVTGRHTNRSDTGKERRLAEKEGVPRVTRPRRAAPHRGAALAIFIVFIPLAGTPRVAGRALS